MADVLESFGYEFDTLLIPFINEAWAIAKTAGFELAKL